MPSVPLKTRARPLPQQPASRTIMQSPGRGTVAEPYVTREESPAVDLAPRWLPAARYVLVAIIGALMLIAAGAAIAQPVLIGNRIEIPENVSLASGPPSTVINAAFIRFTTGSGIPITEITSGGTLKLRWAATIDYSPTMTTAPGPVGPLAGYAMVMVDGQPFLSPLYNLPPPTSIPGARP